MEGELLWKSEREKMKFLAWGASRFGYVASLWSCVLVTFCDFKTFARFWNMSASTADMSWLPCVAPMVSLHTSSPSVLVCFIWGGSPRSQPSFDSLACLSRRKCEVRPGLASLISLDNKINVSRCQKIKGRFRFRSRRATPNKKQEQKETRRKWDNWAAHGNQDLSAVLAIIIQHHIKALKSQKVTNTQPHKHATCPHPSFQVARPKILSIFSHSLFHSNWPSVSTKVVAVVFCQARRMHRSGSPCL